MLIDRPPQVIGLTVDLQKHFVGEPLVSGTGTTATQLIGIGLPEPQTPLPYGFVGHNYATFSK